MTLKLLALVALVVCSAVLTGAEAAYFSLGRSRLKRLATRASDETPVTPLIERPHELLVTLLVGITLVNIGAAAIATTVAVELFDEQFGFAVEMVAMILVLTIFGEVLPMTIAVKRPEAFLAVVGRPVAWLGVLVAPVRVALGALTA